MNAVRMMIAVLMLLGSSGVVLAEHPAEQLVQETTDKVLERLKIDSEKLKADASLIYPLVEDLVLPHFDFAKMSQWVLGKNWRQANQAQRDEFTDGFRTLLVRTYAKALLEYTDQSLRYLPVHAEDDAQRVTVKTEIVQQGGPSIPLHYSMYQNKAGAWKVYDIKVDGVSLVSNYRSSFTTEIRNSGIPGLLKRLAEMNQNAAAGEENSGG
ncbi:MAG: ABC transporter substrate-binding protein [Chromatiales bacterium]|nr:ABC transporter substrate-binding protein [Chromatiales bacterium]